MDEAKIVFTIDKKTLLELGIDPDQAAKDFREYQRAANVYLRSYKQCLMKMKKEFTSHRVRHAPKQEMI